MIQQDAKAEVPSPRRAARDWRRRLPVLQSRRLTLREVRLRDAGPLLEALADSEVTRYVAPPPATRAGFESFIRWAQRGRRAGRYLCFAVVPRAIGRPVGVIQVWSIEPGFDVAEWGFVLTRPYWGTGLFVEAARLVIEFVFETLQTGRLEARSAVANERGNRVLRRLGAAEEGLLRRCFVLRGQRVDHIMWSILADDWRRRDAGGTDVH